MQTIVTISLCFWGAVFFTKKTGALESERPCLKRLIFAVMLVLIGILTFLSDITNLLNSSLNEFNPNTVKFFLLVGTSYLGLRLWDCLNAVFNGEELLNPVALSGYLMPFFMVMAGPISAYKDHISPPGHEDVVKLNLHGFIDALFLLSLGYFLKFFLAYIYQLFATGADLVWPLESTMDTWLYLQFILLEFWGYSLIALGVGRLLGIYTQKNFDHPYLSTTVSDFWTRWHISLGAFVTRNIYTPIMLVVARAFGPNKSQILPILNVFALWLSFVFTGLWHHVSWSFFSWGLLVGLIVAVERGLGSMSKVKKMRRAFNSKIASLMWKTIGIFYTQLMIAATLSIAIEEFRL